MSRKNSQLSTKDSQPLISLCAIVGNVEEYIERFLRSFAPLADEICLVRAIGNQKPDRTIEIAEQFLVERTASPLVESSNQASGTLNSQPSTLNFRWAEYKNSAQHSDWPHLDSFAAARNKSFALARGKYLLWADTDDVFGNGNEAETAQMVEEVRKHAETGEYPIYQYTYNIFGRGLKIHRERMVRRGVCGWKYPVHECMDPPEGTMAGKDEFIVITHLPENTKTGSNERNLRILESIPESEMEPGLWYHLHGEYVFQKNEEKAVWAAKKALSFHSQPSTKDSQPPQLGRPEKYEIFLNLGKMAALDKKQPKLSDLALAEDFFLQAFKADPRRREALGLLTCNRIDAGVPDHALAYAHAMMGLPRPELESWNDRNSAYEWLGVDIYTQALRVNGKNDAANRYRFEVLKEAAKTRPIISLVHATRGRARQASMARKLWIELAERPDALDHIFIIDEDDKESQALLRLHTMVVKPGGGCVRAWNMGAFQSMGDIIIQMSDDWVPPARWDTLIIDRFVSDYEKQLSVERTAAPLAESKESGNSQPSTHNTQLKALSRPRVLAISDGHRKDDLLCMAIMTQSYFQKDYFMFHPWFTGVYSDNYFTFEAHRRKAVIDARDLVFNHNHPFFAKKDEAIVERTASPLVESKEAGGPESNSQLSTKNSQPALDVTYAAQNSPEAYEKGKATYLELLQRRDWSTVPGYCNYWSFYQSVAETLKDGDTVAEIGVWMGRSVILLAQECQRLGKKIKIYAVDNFKGESNQKEHADTIRILEKKYLTTDITDATDNTRNPHQHAAEPSAISVSSVVNSPLRKEFEANIARCEVADMIEILDGDSHRVANAVASESLAFCFIDAAHDFESVQRDIDAWLPKLKKGCAMAGHDAQHQPVIDAVKSRFGDTFAIVGPVWLARKK